MCFNSEILFLIYRIFYLLYQLDNDIYLLLMMMITIFTVSGLPVRTGLTSNRVNGPIRSD